MEKCDFTFRAEKGALTFESPNQSAVRAAVLKIDLGVAPGALKRLINYSKSRASRAPALQLKDNNRSFTATTANFKFDSRVEGTAAASTTNSVIVNSPALGETINGNTHLFRFQGNLDTPSKPLPARISGPL